MSCSYLYTDSVTFYQVVYQLSTRYLSIGMMCNNTEILHAIKTQHITDKALTMYNDERRRAIIVILIDMKRH